jgi:hypothetical protein
VRGFARLLGMLLARYVVRVTLLVAVATVSFAAGMVVMEATSKTGSHPLYFALAVLVAIGAFLLSALLSYRVVVDWLVSVGVSLIQRGSSSRRRKLTLQS